MLYGVDIHGTYQRGISFPTLRAQGYTFAAVKASEGTGFVGPQFLAWIPQIRAAGLIPGAYHWIKRGNGAQQAQFFYNLVRQVGGPEGMLIQLDCEDDATLSDVDAWAAEWRRLSGNHPFLIYSGAWWWGARGWDGTHITPYLWHSHYLTADTDTIPDNPAEFAARVPASWWVPGYGGWSTTTLLQFTSQGDAGSLGNNVDLNVYRGTREQLLGLTRAPSSEAIMDYAQYDRDRVSAASDNTAKLLVAVAGLNVKLDTMLNAIGAIGTSNPDVAAILAGLDTRLDAAVAELRAETRDAVADLGEGGSVQVRADAE
jgi:hypothetical protein